MGAPTTSRSGLAMAQGKSRLDRVTQRWVRSSGRKVSFEHMPWLRGPFGSQGRIADQWITQEAERLGGAVVEGVGLLNDMNSLKGSGFDPSCVAPPIVDFYEKTVEWRMDVTHKWSPVAVPFGWLLSALFTGRLQQLNFPLRRQDTALGVDSKILSLLGEDGVQIGVAWIRTLPATGQYMYSGWYGTATLPGSMRPSLRVVFPLPNGSLIVFLRPENGSDGDLVLASPLGAFGEEGAYLVVADLNEEFGWVRRIPISERFTLGVSRSGTVQTEHRLALWRLPIIRFNYQLNHE